MSFARAKITRFNEKPNSRPNGGLRSKSQIPKISKSLSPSPTPRESPRPQATTPNTQKPRSKHGTGEGSNEKPCNTTAVNENSVHSEGEDYIDALDEKSEAECVESLKESTLISIDVKESIASKSSNSGIPLPLKGSTSKQSTRTTPRAKSADNAECKIIPSPKRTLELQFLTKKKRLDQLKRELDMKQKPVFDLYESLLQIKKKLEDSGKMVLLESMKLLDYEGLTGEKSQKPSAGSSAATLSGGEMIRNNTAISEVEATEFIKNLKLEMSAIPQTCMDLGAYLIKQRDEIVQYLTELKAKDESIDIDEYIHDTNRLNQMIDETVLRQTNRIERVLGDICNLFDKNNLVATTQIMTELEVQVKCQEQEIVRLNNELLQKEKELNELRENKENNSQKIIEENMGLKDRVKALEVELQIKKKKLSDHGMSTKQYEQKIGELQKQLDNLEKARKDAESKVSDVTGHFRSLQNKMKFMEQKWRDEKEEIQKTHKGEHAILEKLTAERQALDTRVNLMNNILDEQKKSHEFEQNKLEKELLTAKEQIATIGVEKQIVEDKLKSLHQEVATLSLQQQQAVDVMKNTMDGEENYITERESQLHTEILALRVALKAAQDRIEAYTTEKMRFIDSIEKLNCSSGDATEALGKHLVQKEEVITRLEYLQKELNEQLEDQKMEIDNYKVQVENLQAGAIVNQLESIPQDTHELQTMLEEGKAKLQKALMKSLDNEQKIIRYEHDINQQKKQFNDMENLLKVRDGLISMLKIKKDELVMENESLHRYSEEIRQLLFDTKEELKQKSDMLEETHGSLEVKNKLCGKLERKIRELEATLSETNEKRFRLQDTVGCMEQELQSTKAHVSHVNNMQTRYDLGMPQLNTDLKIPSEARTTYQQYKTYNNREQQQKRQYISKATLLNHPIRSTSPHRQYQNTTHSNQLSVRRVPSDFREIERPRNQIETSYIGDNSMNASLRKMYYYVPQQNMQNYANYIRNQSQLASNPMYKYYRPVYYRPLAQSLVNFEPNQRIQSNKINSAPILASQRHAKIQTLPTMKYTSSTQTDLQKSYTNVSMFPKTTLLNSSLHDIFEPTKDVTLDPYKLCCDMVSHEQADINNANNEVSESKMRERKEFISVINKLSKFDERKDTKLGLGQEYTPLIFEGVNSYKVLNNGTLMWCHPSKEMQFNHLLITNDIRAHLPTRVSKPSNQSPTNSNN